MNKIDGDSLVDIIFNLRWKSDTAYHTDCYQANGINMWRDYMPPELLNSLMGKEPGERVDLDLRSGEALPGYDAQKVFPVKSVQFNTADGRQQAVRPGRGRFYPKGLLRGISGVYAANIQPFRCVNLENGTMTVDFNHPLAGRELQLTGLVGKVEKKTVERGGTSIDWIEMLTDGPGMQARWRRQATDFFGETAFSRRDEQPDRNFYERPRLVQHIDDSAIEMVRHTYGRFLANGMRVLDLMSSWQSHVPKNVQLERLAGLGMNPEELKRNKLLNDFVIQDLNIHKTLPYPSDTFHVVLNTVSIEYLTDPIAIFQEVARILRPGGYFVVTFSNRWFPPKAIKIWEELHDFERMGLVSEYFLKSEVFTNLHTYSIRGLPRPHTDKYYPDLRFSDPVYAVWGQKR